MVKKPGVAVRLPPTQGCVHQNILDVLVPPVNSNNFKLTKWFTTFLGLREIGFQLRVEKKLNYERKSQPYG